MLVTEQIHGLEKSSCNVAVVKLNDSIFLFFFVQIFLITLQPEYCFQLIWWQVYKIILVKCRYRKSRDITNQIENVKCFVVFLWSSDALSTLESYLISKNFTTYFFHKIFSPILSLCSIQISNPLILKILKKSKLETLFILTCF